MSDHALPMNDQMKIWIRTWSMYSLRHAQGQRRDQRQHGQEQPPQTVATARRQPRLARMPPGRTKIITMKTTKAMT